jgi:hypothetical protein
MEKPPAEKSATWNARRGIVASLIILAAIPALVALWSRLTEPKVASFEPVAHTRNVEERLTRSTPLQAWQDWVQYYSLLGEHGFFEFTDPHATAIEQEVAKRRFLQTTLLVTSAVLFAFAAVGAFWPSGQTRRQGVKETRSTRQ